MKICPKCGTKNRDTNKFCVSCAHDLKDIEIVVENDNKMDNGNINKIVIAIVGIVSLLLLVGFLSTVNTDLINSNQIQSIDLNNDNNIMPSQDENFKNVDFSALFNMYVLKDADFNAVAPKHNSTYEWDDVKSNTNIYYYHQASINDIISYWEDLGYNLAYSEGNKFILQPDNSLDKPTLVGVQSQENAFVIIAGDLETTKTMEATLEFD